LKPWHVERGFAFVGISVGYRSLEKAMFKHRTPEEKDNYLNGATIYLSLLLGAVMDQKHLMAADTKLNEIKSGKDGLNIFSLSKDAQQGAYDARDIAVRMMEQLKGK
jgi:hypothetical protein